MLNMRGRMAYGLDCFLLHLQKNHIDSHLYQAEIDALSHFTDTNNLADWDRRAGQTIYQKYSDEDLRSTLPGILDKLYWIGASELYGQPSNCKESENLLRDILAVLAEAYIAPPDITKFSDCTLNAPTSTDDYFGTLFPYEQF